MESEILTLISPSSPRHNYLSSLTIKVPKDMKISSRKLPLPVLDSRGINMVDLMMWLVIAALLLATAIQSIGYYQKNANVYLMKNEADVVSSRIMASISDRGVIDPQIIDSIVAEENAARPKDNIVVSWGESGNVTASASSNPSTTDTGFELASAVTATTPATAYFIKVTNKDVKDSDVVYFLEDTTTYSAGVHLIKKDALGAGTGAPEGNAINGTCFTGQWRASYYDNFNYENKPVVDRCENGDSFAYSWADSAPLPGVPSDYFSVRWQKSITVPATGDYVFTARGDDYMHVYIDDVRIMDVPYTANSVSKTHRLTEGTHKLRVEMADGVRGATAHFSFAPAS